VRPNAATVPVNISWDVPRTQISARKRSVISQGKLFRAGEAMQALLSAG
jgi:hypothetical protein